MPTYTARFETDANYATHDFKADTPEQVLQMARELDVDAEGLYFEDYDERPPVHTITVSDEQGLAAAWKSDELRLREAAPELLAALDYLLEQTVDMDLKYGITLSEGEEDARAKALAAIARARPDGEPEPQGGPEGDGPDLPDPPDYLAEDAARRQYLKEQFPADERGRDGPDLEP
jgi:hypothetical protein